jgi:hypothetical protein
MDERDLAALIGILAVLEGELVGGEVSPHLGGRIRERLERVGLVAPDGSEGDVRRALGELNQRLRHALGERDEPLRS